MNSHCIPSAAETVELFCSIEHLQSQRSGVEMSQWCKDTFIVFVCQCHLKNSSSALKECIKTDLIPCY